MSANVKIADGRLELSGQITADNAVSLRRQGEGWIASLAPEAQVAVDLTAVTSASSLLLSLLLCWGRAAKTRSQQLTFEGASDHLLELARLNGVAGWLTGSA